MSHVTYGAVLSNLETGKFIHYTSHIRHYNISLADNNFKHQRSDMYARR